MGDGLPDQRSWSFSKKNCFLLTLCMLSWLPEMVSEVVRLFIVDGRVLLLCTPFQSVCCAM